MYDPYSTTIPTSTSLPISSYYSTASLLLVRLFQKPLNEDTFTFCVVVLLFSLDRLLKVAFTLALLPRRFFSFCFYITSSSENLAKPAAAQH